MSDKELDEIARETAKLMVPSLCAYGQIDNVAAAVRTALSKARQPEDDRDTKRLDWLDRQREPISYDEMKTLHAYSWQIEAPYLGLREAIDDAMSSATEKESGGPHKEEESEEV